MEPISVVFSPTFQGILSSKLKNLLFEESHKEPEAYIEIEKTAASEYSCSYCQMNFSDVLAQREHFKLDSHIDKLKQSTRNDENLDEEKIRRKFVTPQGKMYLQNEDNQVFSVHKCLVFKKKDAYNESRLLPTLKFCCVDNPQWTIFLLGGGHFAGAVFQGPKPILHKCFHFYTVRKGQGGSQSSKDNMSATSQPKSAGASLRRHNEQALCEGVRGTAERWRTEIDQSSLVFYSAAGSFNKSVLFAGANPVFVKSDTRLRKIPIPIRSASFKELVRVHELLSSVKMFENLESAMKEIDKFNLSEKKVSTQDAESVENNEELGLHHEKINIDDSSSDDEEKIEDIPLKQIPEIIENDCPESKKKVQEPTRKKKKPKKEKSKNLDLKEIKRKLELIEIIQIGDVDKLKEFLITNRNTLTEEDNILNEKLDEDGNFAMHIAALKEHTQLVRYLLEENCDPSVKNKKHQTPYSITESKEVREFMKEFARENPDKYNYNKAHIPLIRLTKEELEEKKKQQRNNRKEKKKLKKEESKIKSAEEAEKARFLQLSDREKMALAAERRILKQNGEVTARCFLCAMDIAGKVPFEYLNNRFCSIDCLKAHRMKNLKLK